MSEQQATVFIVVAGLPGSGKTTFIRSLNERYIPVQNEATTRQVIDGYQLHYDYGQIVVDESLTVRLLAPPAAHDQALARRLPENTLGVIVLVDSSDHEQLPVVRALIEAYQSVSIVPFIVGATRQDWPGALPPDDLRDSLGGLAGVPVIPCVATDPDSVTAVLIQLLHQQINAIEATEKTKKAEGYTPVSSGNRAY